MVKVKRKFREASHAQTEIVHHIVYHGYCGFRDGYVQHPQESITRSGVIVIAKL
jgi:hypothetical protein